MRVSGADVFATRNTLTAVNVPYHNADSNISAQHLLARCSSFDEICYCFDLNVCCAVLYFMAGLWRAVLTRGCYETMVARCELVSSEAWSGTAVMRYFKYGVAKGSDVVIPLLDAPMTVEYWRGICEGADIEFAPMVISRGVARMLALPISLTMRYRGLIEFLREQDVRIHEFFRPEDLCHAPRLTPCQK